MTHQLLQHLRTLAHANRLANHRLQRACAELSPEAFLAPRSGFFPSLMRTLNHILIVDWYYIAALHGEADMRRAFVTETPFVEAGPLLQAQLDSDQRLIDWCERASNADLDAEVSMDRRDHFQVDRARHVLMHLFTHQIHHRGQAHAMLSSTSVKPPPLDEFVMPSDAEFRVHDLAELGWTESTLFGREQNDLST
jgi:uncharacterized damage-inducible protein DinB